MKVFTKELKSLVFSALFVIYVIFTVFFFFFGYTGGLFLNRYELPPKNDSEQLLLKNMAEYKMVRYDIYGDFSFIPSGDIDASINRGYTKLIYAYDNNSYPAYEKNISLSEAKQKQMKKVIDEIRVYDPDKDILYVVEIPEREPYIEFTNYEFDLTMTEYYALMIKAGNIVGRNSQFLSPEFFYTQDKAAIYEEALEYYNTKVVKNLFENDRLTNGLARRYGTAMNYIAVLFPCFIAMYSIGKDKKVTELLYSKPIKSYRFILIKYISIIVTSLLPFLLLSVYAVFHAKSFISPVSATIPINIDYFAYIKITLLWLLPTILFVVSVTMLLSYLIGSDIAVIAPILFVLLTFSTPMIGAYGLNNIVILFNSEFLYDLYKSYESSIYMNRLFYTMLSIILVLLSVVVYNMKRKAVKIENKAKFSFKK